MKIKNRKSNDDIKVVRQKYTAKTNSKANLKSNNNAVKKSKNNNELNDKQIRILRALMIENNFIDPDEAKDRLCRDMNLTVSISTIKENLKKLKKEMLSNGTGLDTYKQNLITKGAQSNHQSRLNYTHIESLKKYLDENGSIDHIEARNRLQEETGLDVRIQTIKTCLLKLRKETGINPTAMSLPTTKSKEQAYGYIIKDTEIKRLKVYLKQNKLIQTAEAKSRLQKETGFEISIHSIGKALTRLRREISSDSSNLGPSANKTIDSVYNLKLKDMYIEYLKKYLKEDILIGPANASYKLQEETGLRASVYTVRRALKRLKEEMYPEHDIPTSATPHSRAKKSKPKPSYIALKNTHIKRLKDYLKEDNSIEPVEARNRLQEETGLDLNINSIYTNLKRLKKEMGLECTKRSALSSIFDIRKRHGRTAKIKCHHLEYLSEYLKENSSIEPNEARDRLHIDTSLTVSVSAVRSALKRLKEEMGLKCAEHHAPSSIFDKRRRYEKTSLIKCHHLEHIRKYLKQNSSIDPNEVKDKLYKDTCLKVGISAIRKNLKALKKELEDELNQDNMNLDSFTSNPRDNIAESNYNNNLDSTQMEHLEDILNEDSSRGYIETRNRPEIDANFDAFYPISENSLNMSMYKTDTRPESSISSSITKGSRSINTHKLKHAHIRLLKKYLSEDSSIGHIEARNRFQIDTGLEVHVKTVEKYLSRLREELGIGRKNSNPFISDSMRSIHDKILQGTRLEFLKAYFNENNSIEPIEVLNKLQEEAGLEASILSIRKTLKKLNEKKHIY